VSLQSDVEDLWAHAGDGDDGGDGDGDADDGAVDREHATDVLERFLRALEAGEVRAADPVPGSNGEWTANEWVKRGVLLNFSLRESRPREYGDVTYHDVLPLRRTDDLGRRGARNTPDGTAVRRGAYVGDDAILMSPAFVNVGARVGDATLVDSCDVVGSCAQVGDDVKLGANTLVGGVLEPVEDAPVVIEDGVSLGAGCRVTSGFVVGEGSIVGENTLLTPRIPVYDLVEGEILHGRLPSERRAFARYVRSSVSEHDLVDGDAYKPAVVATEVEAETLEATEREEALR